MGSKTACGVPTPVDHIITNMNMLPGDTKPLRPSGLRLGVQELTRCGFTPSDMEWVADAYGRVLLDGVDPATVRKDVAAYRAERQTVGYCFNDAGHSGYRWFDLA